MEKKHKVQVFASYREVEPTIDNAEFVWREVNNQHPLRIIGDRGQKPNTQVFRNNQLYFTFISAQIATIEVAP